MNNMLQRDIQLMIISLINEIHKFYVPKHNDLPLQHAHDYIDITDDSKWLCTNYFCLTYNYVILFKICIHIQQCKRMSSAVCTIYFHFVEKFSNSFASTSVRRNKDFTKYIILKYC